MITPKTAIDEVRKLINTSSVKSLVSNIYAGEIAQGEYNRAGEAKEKFIVINSLPVSFGQVQEGVVNVNLFAPDLVNGVADYSVLDELLLAVKPLTDDGYTNKLSTKSENVSVVQEPTIKYHYYDLRVRVYAHNLNTTTNINL